MNKKELQQYANEMDKKLNYHYFRKDLHFVKDKRISEASRLKLNIISRLKENFDLIIEPCRDKRNYENPLNWFDIFIPSLTLYIKLCQTDEEKQQAFVRWRKSRIVLLNENEENLRSSLDQIIKKIIQLTNKQ